MKPNDLEQLLQRADQAADVNIASPSTLVNRARHRVHRQKQVRVAVGTSVGVALLLFIFSFATKPNSQTDNPLQIANVEDAPDIPIEAMEARIDALRAEADRLEQIVQNNRHAYRSRVQTASVASPNASKQNKKLSIPPQLLIEQEAEITARVMVEQANRWITQSDRRDEAIRSLERTVKLFPNTAAAKTARARLNEINNKSGVTI